MKRFASHYILLPGIGFIKQQVVELNSEGVIEGVFPLTEEIESVEWMPGVIVLITNKQLEEIKNTEMGIKNISVFQSKLPNVSLQSPNQYPCYLSALMEDIANRRVLLYPCLLYPFDFISMQPVDGTLHKLLR